MIFGPLKRSLLPGEPMCNGNSVVPPGAVPLLYCEVYRGREFVGRLTTRLDKPMAWSLRGGPKPVGSWGDLREAQRALRRAR